MRFKQIGAFLRIGQRLDGAKFGGLGGQGYGLDALLFEDAQDFASACFTQMRREKPAIANDYA